MLAALSANVSDSLLSDWFCALRQSLNTLQLAADARAFTSRHLYACAQRGSGMVLELAMGPESVLWEPPTSWASANALVEPDAWNRSPALWLTVTASRPTASPIELKTTQTLLTRPAGLRGSRKSRSCHGNSHLGNSCRQVSKTCN